MLPAAKTVRPGTVSTCKPKADKVKKVRRERSA